MSDRYRLASGNWSTVSGWDGGTLPGALDNVYANSFTVLIDIDVECVKISTAATTGINAGGVFNVRSNRVVSCDVEAGTTTCLNVTGAYTVTGVKNSTGGTVASASGNYAYSSGVIYQTGNSTGGTGASAHGNVATSSGVIYQTGNSTGGTGTNAYGFYRSGTKNSYLYGNAVSSNVSNAVQSIVDGYYLVISGDIINSGIVAVSGNIKLSNSYAGSIYFYTESGDIVSFGGSMAYLPGESDVRSSTTYGVGYSKTGACNVPEADVVAKGVPVDDTVGTAIIRANDMKDLVGEVVGAMWEYYNK